MNRFSDSSQLCFLICYIHFIYKLQKQHICVISTESIYLNLINVFHPVFWLHWKPYLPFIPMNKCIVSLFRCFMFIFPKSSRDKHANIRGALGVKMSGRWRGGVTLWPDSPNIVRTADGKNLVYCSPLLQHITLASDHRTDHTSKTTKAPVDWQ